MSTKFIQLPTCKLAEFINSSATEFDVSGFLYNDGVTPVAPADIGDVCFATLEPKTAREELISFTINSVTAGGVATITAVRGLSQKSPYGTGGATFDHQNGSDFVISNNPGLFNRLTAKDNDETVTGSWQFPTPPVHANNPVPKGYFDAQTLRLTTDQTVAGVKTFSSSPIVPTPTTDMQASTKKYVDDNAVKLTTDQTIAGVKTFSSSPIIPTATTATQAVNKSQVEAFVALNSGDIKASDTAFGTTKLDVPADDVTEPEALTATANRVSALSGGGAFGTPGPSNKFVTETFLNQATAVTFNSSGTWTKPAGLRRVLIQAWGGGGSGGASWGQDARGGGAGGGYIERWIDATSLSVTVSVTVGNGGASVVRTSSGQTAGNFGGNSTFGSFVTAYGGGVAAGITGGNGGSSFAAAVGTVDAGAGGADSTVGGTGTNGGGGGGGASAGGTPGAGGPSLRGGAGGGSARITGSLSSIGGISIQGGNGGAGAGNSGANATATAGSIPGGGGGSATAASGTVTSGAGGNGRIIVNEFYA